MARVRTVLMQSASSVVVRASAEADKGDLLLVLKDGKA
jgi:hypothetical protein